jgi:hypothetical protein
MPKKKRLFLHIGTHDDELFHELERFIEERQDITVIHGSAGASSTDAIVSLSDSSGCLSCIGDRDVIDAVSPSAPARLCEFVERRHDGSLKPGSADAVFSGKLGRPFLILAPTFVAGHVPERGSLTHALKATFDLARSGPQSFISYMTKQEVLWEIRRIAIPLALADFSGWTAKHVFQELSSAIDW